MYKMPVPPSRKQAASLNIPSDVLRQNALPFSFNTPASVLRVQSKKFCCKK